MGISGLLPLLKDIHTPKHVSDYRGQTLGVDAYVWLHRGAFSCAREIVLGQPTTRYISYAVGRILMLQHHGIKPYLVFDGDRLPAKQGTELDREHKRNEHLQRARALEKAGKMTEAREMYAKCVDITPAMAFQLIKYLRQHDIPYVVAPYEADAQLAFLENQRIIDGIITEDSDLLVFGCQKVLFKLDQAGSCVEILRSRFASTRQVQLAGWTSVEFRQMAILSGCDYLPSIVGMGLKNAHRFLKRYKTVEKVLQAVRLEGKMKVPSGYAHEFRKAELTFVHQRVWDPTNGRMTTLTPLPDGTVDEVVPFIGAPIEDSLAHKIATGDVDPTSRKPIVDLVPNPSPSRSSSTSRLASRTSSLVPGHDRPAFSRSKTETAKEAPNRLALSPFYRATPPAKKNVSKEAGLQTIKSFFGASQTQKTKSSTAQQKIPLQPKDTNRPDAFAFMAGSGNGLKRKAHESDPDERENLTPVTEPTPPIKSRFFPKASGSQPKASNPYLELDGRLPDSQRSLTGREGGQTLSWDDCDDLGDLVRSSPSRPSTSQATEKRKLQQTGLAVTPSKRRGPKGKMNDEDGPNDSDDESGFISSPASSAKGQTPSQSSEGKERQKTLSPRSHVTRRDASPISPLLRGNSTWNSDVLSSDPIEADEEQEGNSSLSMGGHGLMARFGYAPVMGGSDRMMAPRQTHGKKVSPPRLGSESKLSMQPVTPEPSTSRLDAFRFRASEPKRQRRMDVMPLSAPASEGRPPLKSVVSTPSVRPTLAFAGDVGESGQDRCRPVRAAHSFLEQFKYGGTGAEGQ